MLEYAASWLSLAAIYAIAASGLKVIVDLGGLNSVAQASFVGLGAYAYAISASSGRISILFAVAVSIGIGCAAGATFGLLTSRSRQDLFVLLSFSIQVVAGALFMNLSTWTGGAIGLAAIPRINIASGRLLIETSIVAVLAIVVTAFVQKFSATPVALVLRGLREDELLLQALGIRTSLFRAMGSTFAGGLGALGGVFFASHFGYIDPSSFTVMESIFILAIVIVAGGEKFWATPVAALLLVVFPEFFRLAVGISGGAAANLRALLYGLLLVAVMLHRSYVERRSPAYQSSRTQR